MTKLSWKEHKGHEEILREFYYLNKYYMTEQLKDSLLDAIECLNYVEDRMQPTCKSEEVDDGGLNKS